MIGREILERKMSYSIDAAALFRLKPKDLVSVKTVWSDCPSRYLVIRVNKKSESIDLLPLEDFYSNYTKKEAPVLAVPFSMIMSASRIDKCDLLFLANNGNPHILNALESLL